MTKKSLKKHEEEYFHIPKPNLKRLESIGSLFLGLSLLALIYPNFLLLISKWKDLGLDVLYSCEVNCNHLANWYQLDILFNIIFIILLIGFGIILIFRGFNKNSFKNLIGGLIGGLITGLILGLIGGLIGGLIYGLIAGLIAGLILGLILGLIGGLITGLILGLIGGIGEGEE